MRRAASREKMTHMELYAASLPDGNSTHMELYGAVFPDKNLTYMELHTPRRFPTKIDTSMVKVNNNLCFFE
jgi:hypothetical protein